MVGRATLSLTLTLTTLRRARCVVQFEHVVELCSPLHLPYISPISPPYLPSPGASCSLSTWSSYACASPSTRTPTPPPPLTLPPTLPLPRTPTPTLTLTLTSAVASLAWRVRCTTSGPTLKE